MTDSTGAENGSPIPVGNESLKLSEPEDNLKPGGPGWVRDAMAIVGLVGAIAGIGISIWGLVEKSRSDADAGLVNLSTAILSQEIAQKQLDAHRAEYMFQAQQHLRDQQTLEQNRNNDLRRQDEQQLDEIVSNLLTNPAKVEGNVTLLLEYIRSDHEYDDLIANAIAAKLDNPRSETEIRLEFNVLSRLNNAKLDALIIANENARERFDAATLSLFWLNLASEVSSTSKDKFSVSDSHLPRYSPAHQLFESASRAEEVTSHDMINRDTLIDDEYTHATIKLWLDIALRKSYTPDAELSHPRELDEVWWVDIQRTVASLAKISKPEAQESQRLAYSVLQKTSDLIPGAILQMENGQSRQLVRLKTCLLLSESWPAGLYPSIEWGSTVFAGGHNFREVTFYKDTWRQLFDRFGPHYVKRDEFPDEARQWISAYRGFSNIFDVEFGSVDKWGPNEVPLSISRNLGCVISDPVFCNVKQIDHLRLRTSN